MIFYQPASNNPPCFSNKPFLSLTSSTEVKDDYGINGNVSVPPPVLLKIILLLIFYNVRSERELAITIPERLDWLWFLDYDLDYDIPNHSV
ncbi:transposase [Thermodesulfobacteriota bacterium]